MDLINVFFFLSWILISAESSNILAAFPGPIKSHHYVFHPILKELAKRGHKITFITPLSLGANLTNVEEIIVVTSGQNFFGSVSFEKLLSLGSSRIFIPAEMSFWFYGKMVAEDCLKNTKVQKLIHSKDKKYDLILIEAFNGQESLIGFSHRFKAPVVSLNSQMNFLFNDEFIGNPLSIAYTPHSELPFSSSMNFYERLLNSIRSFVVLITGYIHYLPQHEFIMKKYFNFTGQIPTLVDMLRNNISLTLVNSHISLDYVRPLMPNVINMPGLHIKKKTDPLPQDLQLFMDSSKNGVIYFSLGTITPVERMPPKLKSVFMNALSKLKQNVLWKANVDTMYGIPSNVKLIKWAPQQSILAHPNCKAFLTHGGLLSQQEAVYFGVPQIGLPMFCDQHVNVERATAFGYGLTLSYKNLTEEAIIWSINEVINNKQYDVTAKHYSKIFRDNPLPSLENAIYWIEYVLRYKGASHLLNKAERNLNYFQHLLLDVILFIIVVLVSVACFVYYALKLLITAYFKYNIYITKRKNE